MLFSAAEIQLCQENLCEVLENWAVGQCRASWAMCNRAQACHVSQKRQSGPDCCLASLLCDVREICKNYRLLTPKSCNIAAGIAYCHVLLARAALLAWWAK